MSFLAWIVLGLVAGFIGSKLVNKTGEGIILDILLGIVGAVLGAIVLGTIDNSLTLLKLSQFWLQAIDGAAILAAVTIDAFITRWMQRALITRRQR